MITIEQLMACNPKWFSPENKRVFGDVRYTIKYGASGQPFLLRSTHAWTDMFGRPKRLHYRINLIDASHNVGSLIDTVFKTRADALEWVRQH